MLAASACSGAATPSAAPATAAQPTAAPASAEPGASSATGCTEPAPATIKIGIEGPFTGPSALTGEEMKNSTTMAFDAIGWKIGPYTIEPVYIDDQSDPAKGAAAYEQAVVSQKIVAGLG